MSALSRGYAPLLFAANPPLPALAALTHRLSARNTQKTLALFPSGCYNAKSYGGVAQLVERCVRNSPLVSTTISKRHRKSGAVCLWRRSRQGSELARNTSPVRASSLFFLAYKRALHPCAQVRRLVPQAAFALPHHPGHVRHPSQTHPIFISLPLWRQGIYSMPGAVHIIVVRHCKERGSGVSYIENVARGRVGRGGSRDRMHR